MNNRKTNHSRNLLALTGILVGMLASQGAYAKCATTTLHDIMSAKCPTLNPPQTFDEASCACVSSQPVNPGGTTDLTPTVHSDNNLACTPGDATCNVLNTSLNDIKKPEEKKAPPVATVTKTIDNLDLTSLDKCRADLTDDMKKQYGLTDYKQQTAFCNDKINAARNKDAENQDLCSNSEIIDSYSKRNSGVIRKCEGTQNIIMGAAVANKASEKIGSMVTTYNGAKAATDAQMSSADVAHNYEISAKLERDTAGVEQGMAGINTAASLLQLNRVATHLYRNTNALKADFKEANDRENTPLVGYVARKAACTKDPAGCPTPEQDAQHQKDLVIIQKTKAALSEQKKWAGKAALGAAESTMAATAQMLQADQLTSAADRNDEYAKELRAAGNPAGGFTTTDTTVAPTAEAPRSGGILGDGTTPVNSLATDLAIKAGGPNLGTPVNDAAPNNNVGSGPVAGTFGAGGTPNGAAGGASSGSGSGSTSADTAGNAADPAAKLADTGKVGGSYDGGSGSGAKSGGGGGGKADNGPDLSGMLAQFLPKKEEETTGKNGILEYGSRGPASMQSESLLDKNANIFQRIHETYQEKNHKGVVGI